MEHMVEEVQSMIGGPNATTYFVLELNDNQCNLQS